MNERPKVNAKVEPRSTFTFTRGLSYIASILFTRVNFTRLRSEKLRHIGKKNPKIAAYMHSYRTEIKRNCTTIIT